MIALIEELYPIPRSMTGDGVRRTLDVLSSWLPLTVSEVASGTRVLDWTIPKEWNVAEAWIKGPDGSIVVDWSELNLHLVAYSAAVHTTLSLEDLQHHLHSLPEQPDAVPYRTAYFDDSWGFCLSDRQRQGLPDGAYEVFIDATLADGSLTYGEFFRPGITDEEIVLSAHICHPSLVNDNLTGVAVAAALGRSLRDTKPRRFGVRIIFAPATIGSIAWLARNPDAPDRVHAGMTLVCLGDGAPLTYKTTVGGGARIDRVASHIIGSDRFAGSTIGFYPFGYDERQYNTPGFRLPFGSLMRSRHGTFPEYHTSLDNPDFISAEQLVEALDAVTAIVNQLQTDRRFRNLAPRGEPQLGVRGLYTSVQNAHLPHELQYAFLWLLSLSDGDHGLTEIAAASSLGLDLLEEAAGILVAHDLLELLP